MHNRSTPRRLRRFCVIFCLAAWRAHRTLGCCHCGHHGRDLSSKHSHADASAAMSDDEDYGFEYSEDDEEEDVNIENQYYNSKGLVLALA